VLEKHNIKKVDKVLFDLGYSSFEIDSDDRGFSFLHEGPLKMTYSQNPSETQLTAHDVVNSFQEENLADIIYGFGEEQFSHRIARGIVEAREIATIETTTQLAQIISDSVPKFYRHQNAGGKSRIHPATKTFQAIRIAVNSELERLKIALKKSFELLDSEGRIAVISFHSLEDRIVKRFFKEKAKEGVASLINKKPIVPTQEELKENPRARSAKLRIIEKT
jgi:16S rRNA (cytosine1402-N4)-methyltransferase